VTDFIVINGSNSYTGATVVDVDSRLTAGGPNTFSPKSAMTIKSTGFLDLNGFDQTVSSLSGAASDGFVTNFGTSTAILTNQGASSTFFGVIKDGVGPIGLT
jgi:hypothetical protein